MDNNTFVNRSYIDSCETRKEFIAAALSGLTPNPNLQDETAKEIAIRAVALGDATYDELIKTNADFKARQGQQIKNYSKMSQLTWRGWNRPITINITDPNKVVAACCQAFSARLFFIFRVEVYEHNFPMHTYYMVRSAELG